MVQTFTFIWSSCEIYWLYYLPSSQVVLVCNTAHICHRKNRRCACYNIWSYSVRNSFNILCPLLPFFEKRIVRKHIVNFHAATCYVQKRHDSQPASYLMCIDLLQLHCHHKRENYFSKGVGIFNRNCKSRNCNKVLICVQGYDDAVVLECRFDNVSIVRREKACYKDDIIAWYIPHVTCVRRW